MAPRTTLASAIIASALVLGATGCATTEASSTFSTPVTASATAQATPAAAASLPVRPESVLLDMTQTAVDPDIVEFYANPAVGDDISAAAEEFIRVGMSFPELEKGSHKPSAADLEVLAPLRPLMSPSYWNETEKDYTAGLGSSMPITLAPGYEVEHADDPAENGQYSADDSGASFVSRNDGMIVQRWQWHDGTLGVRVNNVKARLMFTTPDGKIVFLDRTLHLGLVQAEDGSWDVTQYGGTIDKDGVIATQEELDALPAI
ncbi:hypothetical protein ACX80N_12535 [Arthrobacter sp. MDT2-16]